MKIRPRAGILTIGGELLKGTVLNTNAQFLARELASLGFETAEQVSCRDVQTEIIRVFSRLFAETDLLILTGGLGPTPDDLTRDALAEFFRVPLVFSKKQFAFIQGYYRKRGKKVPPLVRKEAMFPANAVPLFNRFGIALGFYIQAGEKLVVVLPGVPVELENMFRSLVVPAIHQKFKNIAKRFPVIAKTVGLSEPDVMKRLKKDLFDDAFDFGIYPSEGEVALRLYADDPKVARRLFEKIKKRLGKYVYAFEEKTLAQAVGELLFKKKKTAAVAESCTGGLCSAEFTRIAGSSRYFRGGAVAYHADIKSRIGVSPLALKEGEVSPRTAAELARAARNCFSADFGIGITGIAGPGGATKTKPAGLVYIAVSGMRRTHVFKHHFWGTRAQVQSKTVKKALEHLRDFILG